MFLQKTTGHLKEAIDAATAERKSELVKDISCVLSELTRIELTDNQRTSLGKLVEHALSLSSLFSVQRAVYTCVLPDCEGSKQLTFDKKLMENILDAEDTRAKRVRCATFPAVLKAGDEHGDNVRTSPSCARPIVCC